MVTLRHWSMKKGSLAACGALLALPAARASLGLLEAGLLVVVVAASAAVIAAATSLGLAVVVSCVARVASCSKPLVTKGLIGNCRA